MNLKTKHGIMLSIVAIVANGLLENVAFAKLDLEIAMMHLNATPRLKSREDIEKYLENLAEVKKILVSATEGSDSNKKETLQKAIVFITQAEKLVRYSETVEYPEGKMWCLNLARRFGIGATLVLVPLEGTSLFCNMLKNIVAKGSEGAKVEFEKQFREIREELRSIPVDKDIPLEALDTGMLGRLKNLIQAFEDETVNFRKWLDYFNKEDIKSRDQRHIAFGMLALLRYNEYSRKTVPQIILTNEDCARLRNAFINTTNPDWVRRIAKAGMIVALTRKVPNSSEYSVPCEDYVPRITQNIEDIEEEIRKRQGNPRWTIAYILTCLDLLPQGHSKMPLSLETYQALKWISVHGCQADKKIAEDYLTTTYFNKSDLPFARLGVISSYTAVAKACTLNPESVALRDARMLVLQADKIISWMLTSGAKGDYERLVVKLEEAAGMLQTPLEGTILFRTILEAIAKGKNGVPTFERKATLYKKYIRDFEWRMDYLSLREAQGMEEAFRKLEEVFESEIANFEKWKGYFVEDHVERMGHVQEAFTMLALLNYNEYSKRPVPQIVFTDEGCAKLRNVFLDSKTPDWERAIAEMGMAVALAGKVTNLDEYSGSCEDYIPKVNQDLQDEIFKRYKDPRWVVACMKTYFEVFGCEKHKMPLDLKICQRLNKICLRGCSSADRAKAEEYLNKYFWGNCDSVIEEGIDVLEFVRIASICESAVKDTDSDMANLAPDAKRRKVVMEGNTCIAESLKDIEGIESERVAVNMPTIQEQIAEAGYRIQNVLGDGNCGIYAILQTLNPIEGYESFVAMKNAAKQLRQRMFPADSPLSQMVTDLGDEGQRNRWLALDDRGTRQAIFKIAQDNDRQVIIINAVHDPRSDIEDPVNPMFMMLDAEGNVTGYKTFQNVLRDAGENPMILLYTPRHWQGVLKKR